MTKEDGFDNELYDVHYELSDEEQKTSEYGLAMDQLVEKLRESDVFQKMSLTKDFYTSRVEHNY
ncbi:hypothetical protein ACJJIQ_02050 [Microbulbifer sp. ANSA003]|uniref:hypothetical protein n=1 Tax=Microbulbifer sp. ANSA003 TaxID=3243360 RepID=UPI0040436696